MKWANKCPFLGKNILRHCILYFYSKHFKHFLFGIWSFVIMSFCRKCLNKPLPSFWQIYFKYIQCMTHIWVDRFVSYHFDNFNNIIKHVLKNVQDIRKEPVTRFFDSQWRSPSHTDRLQIVQWLRDSKRQSFEMVIFFYQSFISHSFRSPEIYAIEIKQSRETHRERGREKDK